MTDPFLQLSGTAHILASQGNLVFEFFHSASARRTFFRHNKFFFRTFAFLFRYLNYLRDNLACLFYQDMIPYPYILSANLILVMERRAAYCAACELYRL